MESAGLGLPDPTGFGLSWSDGLDHRLDLATTNDAIVMMAARAAVGQSKGSTSGERAATTGNLPPGLRGGATFIGPYWAPGAGSAARRLTLESVRAAAADKELPTRLFDEVLRYHDSSVEIVCGKSPSYSRLSNTIFIPKNMYDESPSRWLPSEWGQFYNELFHAWWDIVFEEQRPCREEHQKLIQNYVSKYRKANQWFPEHAQEEAYSETVHSVITSWAGYHTWDRLKYLRDDTVMPVSHSRLIGFSTEAEAIYPDRAEYERLLRWLFGYVPREDSNR
ncbi:MAG: hypothetical protein GXP27_15185 [Planctomycetes bacterium]|nr:hypothetical protein [Planctomycetota bacterium]